MKLKEFARESKKDFNGSKKDIPIVGLEHLNPSEMLFSNYDLNTEHTFTKSFSKGQVLFGRRRAYLKKAAFAEFDGICSGDITVIEAIPGKVLPELLPFIIQNDKLFDFAISRSVGGLSPRVKWKDLAEFEFDLPSLAEQKKLADKLWAAYRLKESYKKLLASMDKLAESRFLEMFGDPVLNPYGFEVKNMGEVCTFYTGTGFPNVFQGKSDGDFPFYKVGDISKNVQNGFKELEYCDNYINKDVVDKIRGTIIPSGTIVFAKIGEALKLNRRGLTIKNCLVDNNVMGVKPKEELNISYFLQLMKDLDMEKYSASTTVPSVRKTILERIPILVPNLDIQNKYAEFIKQLDKSKSELKKSIAAIDDVIKSLIN